MNGIPSNRRCSRCDDRRNLAIEPAIKGLHGRILCFPCRYKLDTAGGERFLHDMELYPKRVADWQNEFGQQWETWKRLEFLSGLSFLGVPATLVGLYIAFHLGAGQEILFLGLFLLLALCGGFGFSALAEKFIVPTRPQKPVKDERALHSEPELLFDQNTDADLAPEFVHYRPLNPEDSRYPPDWEKRRGKCLERDRDKNRGALAVDGAQFLLVELGVYCCRLCKNPNNLHVHHVLPRGRDGCSHSLQNLITLCSKCHGEQKYYKHELLVTQVRESQGLKIIDEDGNEVVVVIGKRKPKPKPSQEPNNQIELNFANPPKGTTGQLWMNFGSAENHCETSH